METKCKEAVILAGGLGTRLRSVVTEIPKPMAPVANQPFLKYLLDNLLQYNIQHIVLSVGYKHEAIKDFVGEYYNGAQISYAVEETPIGTGGGLKLAFQKIKGDAAFVLNGDTFFGVNLMDLEAKYIQTSSDMCLSLKPMSNFDRYGIVKTSENIVTGFVGKQFCKQGNINGGVYLMKSDILEKSGLKGRFSFETDYMEKEFVSGKFSFVKSNAYFIDIGIPEDYEKAQSDFLNFKQL